MNNLRDYLKQYNKEHDLKRKYRELDFKMSVKQITETLKKPFDKFGVSLKLVDKYFDDPSSKYYQMSQEQILESWDTKAELGRTRGKNLDSFSDSLNEQLLDKPNLPYKELEQIIDNTLQLFELENEGDDVMIQKARNFTNGFLKPTYQRGGRIWAWEIPLYSLEKGCTGRFDGIYHKDGNIILIDNKNDEDLKTENKFEKMRGVCMQYDASDLNIYTIQLYLYKYMLHHTYQIPLERIYPFICNVTSEHCKVLTPIIPYSDKLIEDIIDYAHRIEKFKKENDKQRNQ